MFKLKAQNICANLLFAFASAVIPCRRLRSSKLEIDVKITFPQNVLKILLITFEVFASGLTLVSFTFTLRWLVQKYRHLNGWIHFKVKKSIVWNANHSLTHESVEEKFGQRCAFFNDILHHMNKNNKEARRAQFKTTIRQRFFVFIAWSGLRSDYASAVA